MALLVTEIPPFSIPNEPSFIVFAADRRISRGDKFDDTREKIFQVPVLKAGIGYFGLAEIPEASRRRPMSEWLMNFIKTIQSSETISNFALRLSDTLNVLIPDTWRKTMISGFHIAGFNSADQPEFWYVRNVDDDRQTLFGEYRAREDFRRRDAVNLQPGMYQIYRNGDIRAHVIAWENIDHSLGGLLNAPDFKRLITPQAYVEWLRFKMEITAMFYEKFCERSIIGGPVDACFISAT